MSKVLPVACVWLGLASAFSAPLPAADETVRFNIPAQPLADALLEFSDSSGFKVFFSSDDARNLNSRGLSGNYTATQGIKQLLAGTDLVAQETGTGTVTVTKSEAPKPQTTTTLKAMTVTGEAIQDVNDPYNKSYTVTNSATATKTDTPIMDTPVSIQVVSQAVLKDQQAFRMQDALKNVSGVQQRFDGGGFDRFVAAGILSMIKEVFRLDGL